MEDLLKLHSILTNAYLVSGMKQNDASAAALAELKSGSLTKERRPRFSRPARSCVSRLRCTSIGLSLEETLIARLAPIGS
jgi:hypothetical protein